MKNAKKYDAVAGVRKIRDEMAIIYVQDPERYKRDLNAIREKYFPKNWEERQATYLKGRKKC